MPRKENESDRHRQIKAYSRWLVSELEREDVKLSVTGVERLHVRGAITPAQKQNIRIWKRQLIEALSPECKNADYRWI